MKTTRYYLALAALIALPAMSYAADRNEREDAESRAISNAAAIETEAHNFVEIEFSPGSAKLTDKARESLHRIIKQARKAGKIDEVITLAWADDDYPSKNLKELSKPQRDLADNRNTSIKHYMNSIKKVDIDAYNMAERPNSISKWFNTDDNKMKKAFLSAGLPTTADSPEYASKASHAVILIKVE